MFERNWKKKKKREKIKKMTVERNETKRRKKKRREKGSGNKCWSIAVSGVVTISEGTIKTLGE